MTNQYAIWLARWPVIYVMAVFCVLGVLCKAVAGICSMRLAAQVRRLGQGKSVQRHAMTQRLVEEYRQHVQDGEEIQELDNYIEEAVAGERLLGIHVYQLENWNLTMMVTCFALGVVGSLVAFLNGAGDNEVVFVFTVGLAFTGIMVVAEVLFRNDYYRMLYLLGLQNYLVNVVRVQVSERRRQDEELVNARRERRQILRENERREKTVNQQEAVNRQETVNQRETVNRQARLLEEIANARRQSADSAKLQEKAETGKETRPASDSKTPKQPEQAQAEELNELTYRDSTQAGIAAAREAGLGKTAIDNDLLEDILRSLLMDS